MEMFEIPISILAFIITLWITSFFATLMGAKKAAMIWILAAWSIGIGLSMTAVMGLNFIVLDKMITVILTYFIPFVIFSFIYRILNKMDWAAAITTNITAIAVAIIASVIVIISLGKPLDKTIITMASDIGLISDNTSVEIVANEEDYQEAVILRDQDLLSELVISALERQQKRQQQSYREPKLQLISLRGANSAIGYRIRLLKSNGKVLEGLLSNIQGEELIIKQTLQGGVATTPISMNSVKRLEVYR